MEGLPYTGPGSIAPRRCATALPWLASTYRDIYASAIVGRAEVLRMAYKAASTADWPGAQVLCFIARQAVRAIQGRILVDYTQDAGRSRGMQPGSARKLRQECKAHGAGWKLCSPRRWQSVGAIGISLPLDLLCTHTPS
jgi:hypothetical protein